MCIFFDAAVSQKHIYLWGTIIFFHWGYQNVDESLRYIGNICHFAAKKNSRV